MRKRKALLIFIFTILFGGLISLTYYEVTNVFGTSNRIGIELPSNGKSINASIEKKEIREIKSKKLISLEGWAYIRDYNAEDQKVYLVLSSEKQKYIFDTQVLLRGDLPSALHNTTDNLENAGFKALIEMSDIKDNTYRLGFMIVNGDRKESVMSNATLVKNDMKIEFKDHENEIQNISLEKTNTPINVNLEAIENEENLIKVKGWGYLEGGSLDKSKTYLVLKREQKTLIFDTQPQIREDVTAYFGGKLDLDNSGFSVVINTKDLNNEKYQVGVYIINGQKHALYWSKESMGE